MFSPGFLSARAFVRRFGLAGGLEDFSSDHRRDVPLRTPHPPPKFHRRSGLAAAIGIFGGGKTAPGFRIDDGQREVEKKVENRACGGSAVEPSHGPKLGLARAGLVFIACHVPRGREICSHAGFAVQT